MRYLSARRRLIGGFYAFDNSAKTTKIDADCSVTTDAHGMADCRLDPGVSGEVIAVATTTDAEGHEARAVSSVYLAGDDDWWFGGDNGDRMDIVPDAKSYHAGDIAACAGAHALPQRHRFGDGRARRRALLLRHQRSRARTR